VELRVTASESGRPGGVPIEGAIMTLGTIVLGYIVLGMALAPSPVGPAEIVTQKRRMHGYLFANAINGRETPPEWKVGVFRLLLVLGLVLLWPFALVSLWQTSDGVKRRISNTRNAWRRASSTCAWVVPGRVAAKPAGSGRRSLRSRPA